jgi:hypothetical protein
MQAWVEYRCCYYYQEIFTGDLEKELGTGTQLRQAIYKCGKDSLNGRKGKTGI